MKQEQRNGYSVSAIVDKINEIDIKDISLIERAEYLYYRIFKFKDNTRKKSKLRFPVEEGNDTRVI